MTRTHSNVGVILLVILLASFLFFFNSHAQQLPDTIISWQAENYVPTTFEGKALPIEGTMMRASVQVFQGGKAINLNSKEIIWRVDGQPVADSLGKKTISFKNKDYGGTQLAIEAVIPSLSVDETMNVSVVSPDVTIQFPYEKTAVPPGTAVIKAVPYFFNTKLNTDISYGWTVDNTIPQNGGGDVAELDITIPQGDTGIAHIVTLVARNINQSLEIVSKTLRFTTQ